MCCDVCCDRVFIAVLQDQFTELFILQPFPICIIQSETYNGKFSGCPLLAMFAKTAKAWRRLKSAKTKSAKTKSAKTKVCEDKAMQAMI
jgi:hypothetical protein